MSWCFPFGCECDCRHNSYCPFPEWLQPLMCNPTHFCCASNDNGPTLVIHQILLEPCGNQSCTPRTFTIRVTGPSYPCGETFTIRAGSCTEIDEPLVITGLTPGQYELDLVTPCCREYATTFTGPISGGCISITNSPVPMVITIVCRKRFTRRRCRNWENGWNNCNNWNNWNNWNGGCGCSNGCDNGCGCNDGCGNSRGGCNDGCGHSRSGCNDGCGCNG